MVGNILKRIGILKEVRIYRRLLNLYRYSLLCTFETDKLHMLKVTYNSCLFEFKSNLGTVRIHLRSNCNYEDQMVMDYSNYAGSTVFYINTLDSEVLEIEPMLGEDLTAKDIDLAIYELEEYLYNTYGDIEKLWIEHNQYKDFQRRMHIKQIKELESWKIED